MIPQTEQRDVTSSGADDTTSFDISQDDVAWIMTILRDTLYSDKIMAVLREYGTNAWDANVMAGKGDVPIEVTLPTLGSPELTIRDHGTGLSHDDIRRVYTKYGASTKRTTDVGAGMLGIGSKSGFAYSDSFTITSWNGGMKRIYVAVLSDDKGRCDLLHSEACGEETGLEIKIAVKPQDCSTFEARAQALFVHFVPRPKINCKIPDFAMGRKVEELGSIDERDDYSNRGRWYAVMGPVAYQIKLNQLSGEFGGERLGTAANNIGGVLPFKIGELQIAASREDLKYGDSTKTALVKRINAIIDEYVRVALADIDVQTNWEKRLRIRGIERKNLPVPARYKGIGTHYVNFKNKPSFTTSTKNYNGRQTQATHINVGPEYRFVIKDEKRAISGYKLKEQDIVVSPAKGYELRTNAVSHDLKEMLVELMIDGISVVKLSTIAWEAPAAKNGQAPKPRDAARAKARLFELDPSKPFSDDDRANSWLPVDRVPLDSDVYVILDSYRVRDMEGFYDTYRADAYLLNKVGLQIPKLYGYKSTAKTPIRSDSRKGTEYRKWRQLGMSKLLMTVPDVAEIAQAGGYNENGYQNLDTAWLTSQLGANHMIVDFAAAEVSGKMKWSKATVDIRVAAAHVKSSLKREELEAVRKLNSIAIAYPLIGAVGIIGLRDTNRGLWVDYIKLLDSTRLVSVFNKEAA